MQEVLGVILGGGRGTRLWPLTRDRSKPAVPLGGKYRLIDVPVSNCLNADVNRIFVLTQFNSVSLHRHLARTYVFDEFHRGFVEVLAAQQTMESTDWYQGTADAVRQNLSQFNLPGVEFVLILSGDQLYRMDFGRLLEEHRRNRADVTVAALPVPEAEASRYGVLKVGERARITDFVEKPTSPADLERMRLPSSETGPGGTHLASMGIYLFTREKLAEALQDDPEADDFGREIIPAAIQKMKVHAFRFGEYWADIGTIGSFFEASLDFAAPEPRFNFHEPRWRLFTRPYQLPPARLERCELEGSLVSEGCQVGEGASIRRSTLGVRSILGRGVDLEEVVVMGADYYEWEAGSRATEALEAGLPPIGIGQGSLLRRAIIDKNARIGRDVVIDLPEGAPDHDDPAGHYYVRDGIVVVPKRAVLPDGARIGTAR